MNRDISKIQKVLNSAYHEEQAVEVSRKLANFSFFIGIGLKCFFEMEKTGLCFGRLKVKAQEFSKRETYVYILVDT